MLGEIHSLTHEFPEYVDVIAELKHRDSEFATMSKRYSELDNKIRALELTSVPTTDAHFMELKMERLSLKDKLHHRLVNQGA
ncbi:YdcH family protein [Shewanella salipaludis]|uniref:DUF465 domain-containing protein n=1 Tax=Shewanella salipaludis TaxID=2723052 RepID=A0A972FYE7_9GAMM|nr:DUF465 domain-containing protein [Shewanella salipaludis]NMH65518.1 DUF465 domain-containing protein [Shewanella salipaludis]